MNISRIIQSRDLLYFDPDKVATAYVKTIRLHCGIPAYSLPDFFEKMLLPAIQRPEYRDVSSSQVIKTLVETVTNVDMPVLNFFENADELGVEFFDNCCKLAHHYEKTKGEILSASQLKLPEYIVEAFADFMEVHHPPGIILRKPSLLIAPYRDEAYLWVKLPEEEFPLHYAEGFLEWQVSWIGLPHPESRLCRVTRRNQAILSVEDYFPVSAVPKQVSITLVRQSGQNSTAPEVLCSWTLPVLPSEGRAPLLAFKANGAQIRPGQSLPESVLILIYPRDASLITNGGGRLHEDFGSLTGAWQGWQMQSWDLNGAWAVRLQVNGTESWLPVPVTGRMPDPELSGGNLFPHSISPSEPPLYIGPPPSLKIPLGSGGHLSNWQISAKSVWNTEPIIAKSVDLECLGMNVQVQNEDAILDLRGLLSDQPIGTYDLRVRGPGKVDAEFRLRCWPKLELEGLPGGKISPTELVGDVKFNLSLPENARCAPQAGASDVQVKPVDKSWEVQVGSDATSAALNLIWPKATGEPVRVPLSVPIARLRWSLVLEQNEGDLAWTGHMVQRSVNAFLQSLNSAIHVEMYGLGKLFDRLQIELVDLGNEQTLQSAPVRHTPFSDDWLRIPLGQFSDTLKAAHQGRLDLVYAPWGEQPAHIPLALFIPNLEISDVQLSVGPTGDWHLTWKEETPP